IVAVSLGLAGCGQDASDKPSAAPSSVANDDDTSPGNCCDVDRTKLVTALGGDAGNMRSAPMFGGSPSRNMVNLVDNGVPTDWSDASGKFKNIKWAVKLGDKSYGGPVIADGRVFVGTNNGDPRDPDDKAKMTDANIKKSEKTKIRQKAVLMC